MYRGASHRPSFAPLLVRLIVLPPFTLVVSEKARCFSWIEASQSPSIRLNLTRNRSWRCRFSIAECSLLPFWPPCSPKRIVFNGIFAKSANSCRTSTAENTAVISMMPLDHLPMLFSSFTIPFPLKSPLFASIFRARRRDISKRGRES